MRLLKVHGSLCTLGLKGSPLTVKFARTSWSQYLFSKGRVKDGTAVVDPVWREMDEGRKERYCSLKSSPFGREYFNMTPQNLLYACHVHCLLQTTGIELKIRYSLMGYFLNNRRMPLYICSVWVCNSPPFHFLKHPQGCMLAVIFWVSDAGVPFCGTEDRHLTQCVVDFISQRQA